MGEMTIRNLDDSLMVELTNRAAQQGVDVGDFAAALLRHALRDRTKSRADGARAILAAQSHRAARDSVEILREERARR